MSTGERNARLIDPNVAEAVGELKDENHQAVFAYLLGKKACYANEIAAGLKLSPNEVTDSLNRLVSRNLATPIENPEVPVGIYSPTADGILLAEALSSLNRQLSIALKNRIAKVI